jgi:hypothetical protein
MNVNVHVLVRVHGHFFFYTPAAQPPPNDQFRARALARKHLRARIYNFYCNAIIFNQIMIDT